MKNEQVDNGVIEEEMPNLSEEACKVDKSKKREKKKRKWRNLFKSRNTEGEKKKGKWRGLFKDDDFESFRVRVYTNIPRNAALVGHNMFTKNPKLYRTAIFHLPWFESRYISFETQNRDLTPKTFELESGNFSVVVDAAVSFHIEETDVGYEMGFIERWRSVIDRFKTNTVASIIKTVGGVAATIASAFLFTPAMLLVIPAVTAGYISMFHQDPEWVKEQGAVLAAYNSRVAMEELEQTIYDALRAYYAVHTYEEVKGAQIDLNNPEFKVLKDSLIEYSNQFGISVTKINLKTVDLTSESNAILKRQKAAEMSALEIERTADANYYKAEKDAAAQKVEHDALLAYIQQLKEKGFTTEHITELLKTEIYAKNGATIITGGSGAVTPIIPMPSVNETTQGGKVR